MVNHPNRSRKSADRITKHKDEMGWRIHVDGRPTAMLICKGEPPRYREPQMYFITTDTDDFLMEAPGVGALMIRLDRLARELGALK